MDKIEPLDILLRCELPFRASIIAKELFNLACIVNFFSREDEISSKGSSGSKRRSIKPLKDVISFVRKELKSIFRSLGRYSTRDGNIPTFDRYARVVQINNKLENTLKVLSFLQKKIKYILESRPPYYPVPTVFRDRQESKFYEALEEMVDYSFRHLGLENKDKIISIYWETNTENRFLNFDALFSTTFDSLKNREKDEKIHFLFEGSFFIVNQPSLWPLVIHEALHFYLNAYCFGEYFDETKRELEIIRETIDEVYQDICYIISEYGYPPSHLRTILIDTLVDSILSCVFGPLYMVLLWRILFAYDESHYHIYLPLKRQWFVRLKVPLVLYGRLKTKNAVPLIEEYDIKEFPERDFIRVLDELQDQYAERSFRPNQAQVRAFIENEIVSRIVEKFLLLFSRKRKELVSLLDPIRKDIAQIIECKTGQPEKKCDNLFPLLNIGLSRYITDRLLDKNKIDDIKSAQGRLSEGRINTIFFNLSRDLSGTGNTCTHGIIREIIRNHEKKPSSISDVCNIFWKYPVVLVSFIKLLFDAEGKDFSLPSDNGEHYWFYNLGAFHFVGVDVNFRDKYALDGRIIRCIDRLTDNEECGEKSFLWQPLIDRGLYFYKNDLTLTVLGLTELLKEDSGGEKTEVEISSPSNGSVKSFFENCASGANVLMQVSGDCVSVPDFLHNLRKNFRPERDGEINVLIATSFNWADYIFMINLKDQAAEERFPDFLQTIRSLLFKKTGGIEKAKVDVILGRHLNGSTKLPAPRFLLRLGRDPDLKMVKKASNLPGVDLQARLDNFDLELIFKNDSITLDNLLKRINECVREWGVIDVQIRLPILWQGGFYECE